MKIAQVCPYDYYRGGGVQSHIYYLSSELRKRGHTVKIFAPKIGKQTSSDKDVYLIGKGANVTLSKTEIELTLLNQDHRFELKEILDKEDFDIIHYHDPAMPIFSMQFITQTKVPSVATFHASPTGFMGWFGIDDIIRQYKKIIVSSVDQLIAVSEVAKKNIGCSKSREVNIVPNGIDLELFNPKVKPYKKYKDGKINIFFMGRLDKRKGVKYLIKAYEDIKKKYKDTRLIIGGKGSELKKLKSYVNKKNIQDVEFLGYVEEKAKARYYSSCDIYVSPAISGESFGIVLLEALACGKPAIGGDNPGYRCVLSGGLQFLLVDPKDKKKLLSLLDLLISDESMRNYMGELGLKKAKTFAWPKVASQVEDVYKKTLKMKKKNKEKTNATIIKILNDIKKLLNHKIFE